MVYFLLPFLLGNDSNQCKPAHRDIFQIWELLFRINSYHCWPSGIFILTLSVADIRASAYGANDGFSSREQPSASVRGSQTTLKFCTDLYREVEIMKSISIYLYYYTHRDEVHVYR